MVLVIDPQIAGVSGDMLLCSLVDLGADKTKIAKMQSCSKFLPGSAIHEIDFKKNDKNGINAVELILKADDAHKQTGNSIRQAIVSSAEELGLSGKAKQFAESCIDTLIYAESKIHGVPVSSVHLHEASGIDTLVDIIGVATSLEDLGLFDEKIVCMPIAVGSGSVEFSHGTMSNPASAVLEILKGTGLHICGSPVQDELTTPTGACILRNLAISTDYYPYMEVGSIGYGSGKKDFESFSNVLKLVRGNILPSLNTESVKILETNVDDVPGEILGALVENLMEVGARDVSIYPGITKKNRPTNLVSVMCDDISLKEITDILIGETRTLGVRVRNTERLIVPRTIGQITVNAGNKKFDVRYKTSSFGGRTRIKVEHDDLLEMSDSLKIPLMDAEYMTRKEIERRNNNDIT